MRILVTNDDGVHSPGLHVLARALSDAGHHVFVVAPSGERSGASAAIGMLHRSGPFPVSSHDAIDVGGDVFAIDTTPAAIVYAACLGGFGPPPDLVASGINPGPNTGHLVLHSGTVGAALTAAGLGIPGLAVSLGRIDGHTETHWESAAAYAVAGIDWTLAADRPIVTNINVPNRPLDAIEGVEEARLAPYGSVWVGSSRPDGDTVVVEFGPTDVKPEPGTDLALVSAGFVAVTPLDGIAHAAVPGAADALRLGVASVRAPH
ncbi:MAG: 5'/3'-nucleotidase SurE [Acidimicrobiia bacterium]